MKKVKKGKTSLDTYQEIRKPMPKPVVIHNEGKRKKPPQSDYKNISLDPDDFDDFDPEDLDF
jgi:hypothetical protein